MRYLVTLSALLMLVLPSVAASGEKARRGTTRTITVKWNERKVIEGDNYAAFHVSKIVVAPRSWAVSAAIANHSTYTLNIIKGTTTGRGSGMSILYYVPPPSGQIATGGYLAIPAQYKKPGLVVLRPGETWSGTFGGTGALPKHKALSIGFGYFTGSGLGGGFNWITDHTFTLK
jgi:hypothetical protein